ncbi:hypothetical protein FQA39_LY17744 [Lamprigera yunnana]|nr:hypothetical protein FQA39_LY17744 [Lamprigera yunnana]
MLCEFISCLDSASSELNGNKLGRSIIQEQEKSLNFLSITEVELRLPCSTYEDFQNLYVKLEDVQVKAAVVNSTIAPLHCTYSGKKQQPCYKQYFQPTWLLNVTGKVMVKNKG